MFVTAAPVSPWLQVLIKADLEELEELLNKGTASTEEPCGGSSPAADIPPQDEELYEVIEPELAAAEAEEAEGVLDERRLSEMAISLPSEAASQAASEATPRMLHSPAGLMSRKISVDPDSVDIPRFSLITGHHSSADSLVLPSVADAEDFRPQHSDSDSESDDSRDSDDRQTGRSRSRSRYQSLAELSQYCASEISSSFAPFLDPQSPAPSEWFEPADLHSEIDAQAEAEAEVVDLCSSSSEDQKVDPPAKRRKMNEQSEISCKLCGKQYRYKSRLQKHMRGCRLAQNRKS